MTKRQTVLSRFDQTMIFQIGSLRFLKSRKNEADDVHPLREIDCQTVHDLKHDVAGNDETVRDLVSTCVLPITVFDLKCIFLDQGRSLLRRFNRAELRTVVAIVLVHIGFPSPAQVFAASGIDQEHNIPSSTLSRGHTSIILN